MTEIEIECPTCKSIGNIDVSEKALECVERGLLAVNIAPKIICEHTFVVYIDKNMDVRNYFTADFQLELPETKQDECAPSYVIPDEETIDIDLIKLNLAPLIFSYILKSIFSKQKILLISEKKFLWEHLNNFFSYITQNNFEATITFITTEEFKESKRKWKKEYMIFDETTIINNLHKTIDINKIKIEKQIVNRFLSEQRLSYSYILLRNDLNMAYDVSQKIMSILENLNRKEQIGKKELIDLLKKQFDLKISFDYLEFVLEILEKYFEYNISSKVSTYFIPNLGI
ncbi:MAG: hypothetical protein BAJALOKI1v1_1070007 [Promethearchaeota archaeon]|nr:MAG: hypothetical protein BAJALOKI1v1_1070007 [Candidatus Lokiarchaeota archaeon]